MSDVMSVPASSAGARCAFCDHLNPADAKYCNECAADLQLMLCPECSAVNRRGMPHCHKCGAGLPHPQPVVERLAASEVSATARLQPRRRSVVAPLALLAIVGAGIWYVLDGMPNWPAFDLHSAVSALRFDGDTSDPPRDPRPERVAGQPAMPDMQSAPAPAPTTT